jgi:hypothetical protein
MTSYLWIPILAFTSMFMQDVFSVWLVRAENAGRAHAAARWDVSQDACRIAGFAANTDAILLSHNLLLAAITLAATFTADYWGSYTGVELGVYLDGRREAAHGTA